MKMEPACFDCNGGVSRRKNLKSISSQTSTADSDHGCFECNICLESAHDPVVTLCGHLYCWPCIFKWLQVQDSSDESDQLQPTCPVCKADLSHTSLVPLYGRGAHSSDSEPKKTQMDIGIPRRPPPHTSNATLNSPSASTSQLGQLPSYFQSQTQQYLPHLYGGYAINRTPYLGVAALTSLSYPIIDMFRETVFAGIFGSSGSNSLAHRYARYYPHIRSDSHRMRRQEMLIDKSLSRVSFFLLCCVILCLLLF
ncbi:E3 ubiquitin-protein ligase RMA3 isoform X2 [Neltuma alba]|uniref:E3 ubiquitin-protein ligase RMA3 isoform X2 n=1 Tax=Neltuma alba TaxID=207710 RepID=UPI0010A595C6|nr:E3 ubiquitin-protein ligase RMA3-like isoform X2 [Prosopis alba]